MPETYKHLFISDSIEVKNYKTINGGGPKNRVFKNNVSHGNNLLNKIRQNISNNLEDLPEDYYAYITVNGNDELIENIQSLENGTCKVKISNIKQINENDFNISLAINKKYLSQLVKKINAYITEVTKKGNPKHQNFLNSLEDIKKSILQDLWIGDESLIPSNNLKKWCEVWILENSSTSFCQKCDDLEIEYAVNSIQRFIERTVLHINANYQDLQNLIEQYPYLGEFRPVNTLATFWAELPRAEQIEWSDNLRNRTVIENENSNVAISVLDTGVNNGNPLLERIITENDCDSCNATWNNTDNEGHGTAMCAISAYGNLQKCLESNQNITLKHSVSSIKVLPYDGYQSEESSYGNITKDAVSRATIINPTKNNIHCLAVTENETANITGLPSAWSATIDSITSGQNLETPSLINIGDKNLFLISAGNYDNTLVDYPEGNKNTPIQSPAQAWNALTIGAYTNLLHPNRNNVASSNQLSPYSRTSIAWSKTQWPIKPEVLFEGGNKVIDGNNSFQTEETSILTLDANPTERVFTTCSGTSPATAEASNFAAKIACEYPELWPETIRALMVHSAKWTEEMERQFLPAPTNRNKGDYVEILRTCGYGIPNLTDALYSANNSLVLIAQNEIQPYKYNEVAKKAETNQMHLYELPWPKDALLELGNTEIEMKVTLSYFIEPAPFSMGKISNNKYRYSSYGLRFDVNRFNESKEEFTAKINQIDKELAKSSGNYTSGRAESMWKYSDACGVFNGSLHSNVWNGTAAELAQNNLLAVYPVMGWWKDRPNLGCCNKHARYALIVSLKTPSVETDIYTPVANQINIPVENITPINI